MQENFNDIAVPKLIAAAAGFGIIKDADPAIASDKFHIQKFGRPEEANFSLAMRIGIFSLPVTVEEHGFCGAPRAGKRETSSIDWAMERSGDRCIGKCCGGRGEPFAHVGIFVS